jgi:uncharacterized protein (TIGR03435 family)
MRKLLSRMSAGLVLTAAAMLAQTPAPPLAFEVASIKPAGPINPAQVAAGKLHVGMKVDAARVDIGFMSVADLIRMAYKIKQYQLTGPDWMTTERFDVLAKMPAGATAEQVPEMLQTLLADRFKLALHRTTKEHGVYALVVGKGGLKMKESPPDPPASEEAAAATPASGTSISTPMGQMRVSGGGDGKGMVVSGGPMGKMKMSMQPGGTMHMEAEKMNTAALAEMLTRFVDKPVIDETELKGTYQRALDLSMEELRNVARAAGMGMGMGPAGGGASGVPGGGEGGKQPAEGGSEPSGGSIFTSVQQLGLKLESKKLPLEFLVVDHVEKTPSEN